MERKARPGAGPGATRRSGRVYGILPGMLKSVGVPLLAALIGGAIGGVVGARMMAPAKAAKARAGDASDSTVLHDPGEDAPIEARIAAVERAIRELERRPRGSTPALRSRPDDSEPSAPTPAAPIVDDPVFEAAVRDVMDRVGEERESERDVERDQRRQQVAEGWADQLGEKLSLTDPQKTKVKEVIEGLFQKMRDLRESRNADAGAFLTRSQRFAQMRELGTEAEGKLKQVLDGKQMAEYESLDGDLRLGGARPWGPGRGRGRGGP